MPGDLADATRLANEQAALRRVAELVAAGASEASVFDAVADEACRLLGDHFTALLRFEPDEPPVIVAMGGADAVRHVMHVGMRISEEGDGVVQRVRGTGQAARIERYERVPGPNAAIAHELGLSSGVGAPILTEGEVWGAITVLGSGRLPASAEDRLRGFAELAATAISNAQARTNLAALAREQAGLLRVAELVARGVPQEALFESVATEASRLLDEQAMTLARFDSERELVVVAVHGGPTPIGTRIVFDAETLPDFVRRDDRPVRVDDYARERDARLAARFGLAAAVAAPISVQDRVWGMLTATSADGPLPAGTEQRLEQFAKLVASALANGQARTELQALADEQAALRRVAELAAQEAPVDAVLEAVAVQASKLAGVDFTTLLRFEPDGSTEIVAVDGAPGDIRTGMRAPAGGDGAVQRVWHSGHAARIDDLAEMSGHWPQVAHDFGFSASVAVPILLERRLWGALVVVARSEPLPVSIEQHLTDFAELASTAIAAAQTRSDLHVLAHQQAALRRVAELVAHGAALDEVFSAVATEASKQLGEMGTALLRYDPGDVAVVVARCNRPAPLDAGAGVAVPVTVEGRVWGALTTTSGPALATDTEDRLMRFAELAAAAIANAENKAKLTASRARVVATADETRRRLQRDLHDGAQQRLVHAQITLELAKAAAAAGRPTASLIDDALAHTERANRELRDLVRGILPAALTGGGLQTGIESLTDDIALPVDLRVNVPRLPPQTETTAYFIVAEALTNVIKHANATRATVEIALRGRELTIRIRDDGVGGADPTRGTGLTGLLDRIEAAEGTLDISSPPGDGTTLHATLRLAQRRSAA